MEPRDDGGAADRQNYWQSVEGYISAHTSTQFSHSICLACCETRVEPEFKEGL